MSTENSVKKKQKNKERKPSKWLENSLTWLEKQQQKWYGFLLNIFALPLLFVFALISWPIRHIIELAKGFYDN